MNCEIVSTSPTGRYTIEVFPWEARMSHWVETPEICDTLTNEKLFCFSDINWSLDTASWQNETVVRLLLRKYPGNHAPSIFEVMIDCEHRTATFGKYVIENLHDVEQLLEQKLSQERSTILDGATKIATSPINISVASVKQLKALAWLHILLGGAGILLDLIIVFALWQGTHVSYKDISLGEKEWGFLVIMFLPFASSFIGGLGLLKEWTWAKLFVIGLSVLYLNGFPWGTAVGAFGLWVLLIPKILARLCEVRMSFQTSKQWRVDICSEGRGGSIAYLEGQGVISGWWEFGGGDTIAILSFDEASIWNTHYPWASERRREILERIAHETIRQRAPHCRADIDEENGFIYLRKIV